MGGGRGSLACGSNWTEGLHEESKGEGSSLLAEPSAQPGPLVELVCTCMCVCFGRHCKQELWLLILEVNLSFLLLT